MCVWGGGCSCAFNSLAGYSTVHRTSQAVVVEAQAAVHRHRTGTGDVQPDAVPNAGGFRVEPLDDLKQVSKLSMYNPEGRSSTAGGINDAGDGTNVSRYGEAAEMSRKVDVVKGAGVRESAEALLESRKKEEADALSSQLQLIAAHLVRGQDRRVYKDETV